MAKYFLDCEFREDFHKPAFGKRRHFIDLISIGIVCEDTREYYAISNEFDLNEVWNKYQWKNTGKLDLPGITRSQEKEYWLRENVLHPIWKELAYRHYRSMTNPEAKEFHDILDGMPENERVDFYIDKMCRGPHGPFFEKSELASLIKKYGKSNKQIASEVIEFVNPGLGWPALSYNNSELRDGKPLSDFFNFHNVKAFDFEGIADYYFAQPTFYGYFSAYDHVVLCSLFGTMMDLPVGFPMYTRDLKQMVDDWVIKSLPHFQQMATNHDKHVDFDFVLSELKKFPTYPKQTNEHSAISDARWNFELYKFITS